MAARRSPKLRVPVDPPEWPSVTISVPVYNEEHSLAAGVTRLHEHLLRWFPFTWRITIADNASTDDTWMVAVALVASAAWIAAATE